jgi:hypothetical protein
MLNIDQTAVCLPFGCQRFETTDLRVANDTLAEGESRCAVSINEARLEQMILAEAAEKIMRSIRSDKITARTAELVDEGSGPPKFTMSIVPLQIAGRSPTRGNYARLPMRRRIPNRTWGPPWPNRGYLT